MNKQKGFIIPAVPLIIIVLILAGAGVFYLSKSNISKVLAPTPSVKITLSPSPVSDETANWKTYTNNTYHLGFKYPGNYSFNENADKIEINSPLSSCNPALVFNSVEYKQIYEVQIAIKKRYGSLEKILEEEGGKNYGWEEKTFNGKKGFSIDVGAEMITPYTRYLVEGYTGEVLDIQNNIFVSDDQGKCVPKLNFGNAQVVSKQILSTFKFLSASPAGGDQKSAEGKVCGGFGGEKGQFACPAGYKCKHPEPMYPDAQGQCVRSE